MPTDSPAQLTHLQLEPGYTATVFQDFSASFTFNAQDWMEDTEFHDNQPDYLFTLDTPYPKAIGVIAGRVIYLLDGTALESHDFGMHARNTLGQADNLTQATLVRADDDDQQRTLFVSSASEDTGDGSFKISPAWVLSADLDTGAIINNTRSILGDDDGAFDGLGVPERYLGTQNGLVRRSSQTVVVSGDMRSLHLVNSDLYLTRFVSPVEELVRVASMTHTTTVLGNRGVLRLADGPAPAPHVAYAMADLSQVVLVRADGTLDVIASLLDDDYKWTSVAIPPPGHPLAGRIYVLENNRALDLDRVLAITPP